MGAGYALRGEEGGRGRGGGGGGGGEEGGGEREGGRPKGRGEGITLIILYEN